MEIEEDSGRGKRKQYAESQEKRGVSPYFLVCRRKYTTITKIHICMCVCVCVCMCVYVSSV